MRRRQFLASAPLATMAGYLDVGTLFPRVDQRARAADTAQGSPVETRLDRWALARKVSRPPALNGAFDDPLWQRARPIQGFVTPYFNEAVDADIQTRLLYDETNLYVGFAYASADGAASVANVELLLSPAEVAEPCFRVPVEVRTVEPPFDNTWGPDLTVPDNVRIRTGTNEHEITGEIGIPFDSLGVGAVPTGAEWRFNVLVQHEMMTQPLSSWVPVRRSSNSYSGRDSADVRADVTNESRLGTVFLGALSSPDQDSRPLERCSPENLVLDYVGFTQKHLSFDLLGLVPDLPPKLWWRAPGQAWQSVDPAGVRFDANTLSTSFQHPPPRADGLYELRVLVPSPGTAPGRLCTISFDRHAMITAGDAIYPGGN